MGSLRAEVGWQLLVCLSGQASLSVAIRAHHVGVPKVHDCVTNPAVMLNTGKLLAGRPRDIRLPALMERAFRVCSWRQAAKIVRPQMVWVGDLEVLTLTINAAASPSLVDSVAGRYWLTQLFTAYQAGDVRTRIWVGR